MSFPDGLCSSRFGSLHRSAAKLEQVRVVLLGCHSSGIEVRLGLPVVVYYYFLFLQEQIKGIIIISSTQYKSVRVGGGGSWRTCAMRYDEPRLVWTSLTTTH